MKNTLTLLTCLFCIQFLSGQNFRPISSEFKNLYFTQDGVSGGYLSPKGSHVRMDFDSIILNSGGLTYFPYRTARYKQTSLTYCEYYLWNSWLGQRIKFDSTDKNMVFYYVPLGSSPPYFWVGEETIYLKYDAQIGEKWFVDVDGDQIQAEVISIEPIIWEGLADTVKTIEFTNYLDNPAYQNWEKGLIKISKNFGLVNFPNLQYFPAKWIDCERVGMVSPKAGVQDPSPRDMFHMKAGDEYTAEFNYELAAGIGEFYYKNVKCLELISDVNNEVTRYVEINIYKKDNSAWTKETVFETQIIDYKGLEPFGKANEYIIPYSDVYLSSLVLLDSLQRKLNIKLSGDESPGCIEQPTDVCNNYFSYKGAFDTYHECNGGWNKYDYYLPRYIKNGDDIWGEDVNFDSLLTTSKISWNEKVNFYPNPNTGTFSFDNIGNNKFKVFRAVNNLGKEIELIADNNASRTDLKLNAPSGVYFIYGIDNQDRFIGLGSMVKAE